MDKGATDSVRKILGLMSSKQVVHDKKDERWDVHETSMEDGPPYARPSYERPQYEHRLSLVMDG